MIIEVLVELKAREVDKTFTYSVPSHMVSKIALGRRVKVPFGKRELEGFILKINEKIDFEYDIKDIISVVDEEDILNEEMLELGHYVKKKTMSTLSAAYQSMLPTALKAKANRNINVKTVKKLKINPVSINLTKNQLEFLSKIHDGILKSEANLISSSITKKLIELNILEEETEEIYRLNDYSEKEHNNVLLTEPQKEVVSKVISNLSTFKPFLLHGITGSGKTEVYMHIIDEVIKNGKEVIVLVPEISLTPQIVEKFKKRFGGSIAILHSRLSDGEKYDEWRKINRGLVNIVIGARSAVFAPFKNIGAIIIDEEHSLTYKQENNPKYNAIDIAIARAKRHNAILLLGSATPSIESYTRAKMGLYELLTLKNRINNTPPTVHLVEMREELKKNNKIFSSLLLEKIKEKLAKKEQIILFLNRRGFSTVLTCGDCGFTFKCPNCDIPLTYHKNKNELKCHYCDYHEYKYNECHSCHSKKISYFGLGTEKLEEELKKIFPSARTLRMDIDTTALKNSHEKIIKSFELGEADILIGTQMISKGLDFAKVTLVGVINADATLNIPDFRSAERTFSLLNQVSGRSGRSDLKGEVVIQTFNKEHYSIVCSVFDDYDGFYKREMSIRKELEYPPFCDLVLIKIKSLSFEEGMSEGDKIVNRLKAFDCKVLGPTSATIPKIKNIYQIQIIIKCKNSSLIRNELEFLNNLYLNKKVKIDIEFNPLKI